MHQKTAEEERGASLTDYGIALVAVLVAVVGRVLLQPLLSDRFPFSTLYIAVGFAAWYGGLRPGVFALVLSAVAAILFIFDPHLSLALDKSEYQLGLSLFGIAGLAIVLMFESLKNATRQSEAQRSRLEEEIAARRVAEQGFSDQAERLRITLASIGDAVITTDVEARITSMNAVAELLTGSTAAAAMGQHIADVFHIVHEATRNKVDCAVIRALKYNEIVGLGSQTVLIARDSTERNIEESAAPIRCREGKVVGSVLVFRDVTESHRLAAKQSEMQAQVISTLESVTDGFLRLDSEWRIVYANAEAERIHELSRTELLGKYVWELFPAWVGTTLEFEFRRAVADHVAVEFENYYPPMDRWFSFKGYPTPDGGLTTFTRDVTEQKIHQEKVRRSEARLRRVFESNVVGMIRWDLDRSLILEANDTFLKMSGYTRDDVAQGRLNFRDITPPEWTPRNEEGIRAIRTDGYASPYEKEYFRKDGSRLPLVIAGTRFEDSLSEGMSILIDISESKRAEAEIARLAAESERQRRLYETVLTNTPDFVYVFSLDHRVIYANEALIRMWGRGYEGAIGKTFLEIGYEPWHAEMHNREIDQVRMTRQPVRGEVPFDGTQGLRQYEYIFVPVIGADGEVEAVAGTTRDITDRKYAETAVREGERKLRLATHATKVGVWEWNVLTGEVRWDATMFDMYGIPPTPDGTLHPRDWRQAVFPADLPEQEAILDDTIRRHATSRRAFRIQRQSDGECRHIQSVETVRTNEAGQAEWVVGTNLDVTEREQLLRQVDGERGRLADVFRQAPAFMCVLVGPNHVFELANESYIQLVGSRPLLGRSVREALPEVVDQGFLELLDEVYRTGEPFVGNDMRVMLRRNVDQPPEERFVDFVYKALRDAGGVIIGVVTVGVDVTDRRKAEETLHQSEDRSAFVRRSSGVGFWYCDLPFGVLQWDDLVRTHFHVQQDATVTMQTFYERIHPDDRDSIRLAIERSIANRTPYNEDYRTVNPESGVVTWIRAIGRTSYAPDGTPKGFDGVTLDVSDQKRAEASLRESEQRFRLVADAAPVLIWIRGTNKLCSWVNQPWLAFTGRSMDLELGNGWTTGIHPDDFASCLETYEAAFDARVPFSMEYRLRRYDGEFRWLIDNGVPKYTAAGEFDGYIGSCLDVTDYKNAETGLREAARHKDEFLATLAHELRNPLAPIRNGLQIIKLAEVNQTVEEARTMMERQLTQMVRLVDDLLDVSRISRGKIELRTERIAMHTVISAAVETSRPLIEEAGHALVVTLPNEPIYLDGDSTRLAQVVSNLLTNSAKYMNPGGNIELRVSVEEPKADAENHSSPSVTIRVRDAGIGIPAAMLDKVFVMFTQVDRTLEKSTGGLGIGLSLVKGLVEMHGGTIVANSDGEGKGSEFVITLPGVSDPTKPPKLSQAEAQSFKSSHRILVVDDNRDGANTLAMMLKIMGNDTRTAYDGQAGVGTADEFRPDVILLDIGLPKMNGHEACRTIRKQSWGKSVVLIAVTGWGQEDDRRRSHEAGFDYHLVKPVDPKALMKMLAEIHVTKPDLQKGLCQKGHDSCL